MSAPSWGTSPVSTISTPVTRKPPTAAGHPPSTVPVEASSAAPGVDQATVIGIRVHHASRMQEMPMRTLTASNPLDAWPGSAPTPARPLRTTTNALVKPTSAETTPAEIGRNTPFGPAGTVTRRSRHPRRCAQSALDVGVREGGDPDVGDGRAHARPPSPRGRHEVLVCPATVVRCRHAFLYSGSLGSSVGGSPGAQQSLVRRGRSPVVTHLQRQSRPA